MLIMDLQIVFRRPLWWSFVATLVLIAGVGTWLVAERAAPPDGELADSGQVATDNEVERRPAASDRSRAAAGLSGFVTECARPNRTRERLEIDYLLEIGCVGQLSTALTSLVEQHRAPEMHGKLEEHNDLASTIAAGDWQSSSQTLRVREAFLSATEVIEMLSHERPDVAPEVRRRVARAREVAMAIRSGVPLSEQTSRTDSFFRESSQALELLAGLPR